MFTTCIRVLDVGPTWARLPALMGASVQFFGNRTFTFRAQRESISRQAKLFMILELVTLALNYSVCRFLVPRVTVLPPELVSMLGTLLPFVGFAYPMRKRVIFRVTHEG